MVREHHKKSENKGPEELKKAQTNDQKKSHKQKLTEGGPIDRSSINGKRFSGNYNKSLICYRGDIDP